MEANYSKTRRATFNLTVHIVLVTKYRRKVFQKEHLEFLLKNLWRAKTLQSINCASLFPYWLAFHLIGETESLQANI
ncbi:transposase [Arthrospira platensis]|uniref:Transposase n=1 Tax=Limnospira platensis NIES-46 TaxID=1236695 RepID=A0A5M3T4M8_LIMPL|nr:hypothetical protein AP285_24480 [Arthrospira platensis YZ]KDR56655.1 hypothetical protein APPUASWS_015610 [Arthrospira platensis str. Paraca]MDF2207400.1 transposase [Arthrospira platensis NCB002]MDT9183180.1 transposase [Limnospira sp. PMC 289.06]QQW28559.1 transposase [Arthrospira sp. PCC 9108]BDT15601.1 hypothetical protein N39L_53240 [Arthrospira platensis NIES-39]GCE92840.1 transposase [Arthrospira platensis NIES-46]